MAANDSGITHKTLDLESMSPENEDEESPKSEAASNKSEDNAASEAAQKQAAKRRTKTGCLSKCSTPYSAQLLTRLNPRTACRKRRIKCGEEKPVSTTIDEIIECHSHNIEDMQELHKIETRLRWLCPASRLQTTKPRTTSGYS